MWLFIGFDRRSGCIDMELKLFGSFAQLYLGRGITVAFFRKVQSEMCYPEQISYKHTQRTLPHREGTDLTGKD